MFILLYATWAGFVWVLRGGWLGGLARKHLSIKVGTTVTRLVCAGLLTAPLCLSLGWWSIALWPSIYVAMVIGYFDDAMGLEEPGRDHIYLALWGLVVTTVALTPLVVLVGPASLLWALMGTLAVVAYWVNKPFGRRFGWDWTERAEWCMGVIFGSAIYLGAVQ